ncbi:ferric reductase-like transmembrane domain-containing protein [Deferribacteraceae bacterium V6Fe1]|nr:ferric reductase-like transmembrane domain-containing protein [Deferribacteraceae bacterium V6Fe1]
MKAFVNKYNYLTKLIFFMGITIMLYYLQNFPRRSIMKEAISLLTVLSFTFMAAQFYFTRAFRDIECKGKMSHVVTIHKITGYIFSVLLVFHPFLIVLPRYFEGGIKPQDAFLQIITTLNNKALIAGMIAWFILIILGITSFLREKFFSSYINWRWFHGGLSLIFIGFTIYHAVSLGRHFNLFMSMFYILLIFCGVAVLLRMYVSDKYKKEGLKNG